MKYNWNDIETLIRKFGKVQTSVQFRPAVGLDWEHFVDNIYVRYDDPNFLEMAAVYPPDELYRLTEEDRKDVEDGFRFSFLFLALTDELEERYGKLPKKMRKKIVAYANEIFK